MLVKWYIETVQICVININQKKYNAQQIKVKIEKIKIQHIENNDDSDKGIFSSIKDKFFK